jgi:3-deoxy-D-manno-octulosonate 8-phosphate phosphatase (KDO 8-P phosphatase)
MDPIVKAVSEQYLAHGAIFLSSPEEVCKRLDKIKAYVFDWDGVFNAGSKNERGTSDYNEVDSMGINMLRFSHWLKKNEAPVTAIISGEKNSASFQLCSREHFTSCYYKVAHKTDALDHLCATHKLRPEEIAFVFDDILDLSIADRCGVRILINRPGVSMVRNYVVEHKLADYITASTASNNALREACEMLIGIQGYWSKVMDERIHFSTTYQKYLHARNEVDTTYFSRINQQIEEANP